jgi:uncharacterized protein
MRVIISGGTGLIGRSVIQALMRHGHEIVVLSRDPARATTTFARQGYTHVQTVGWDGQTSQGWGGLISQESAIVNLAGATPAHWRWTKAYRARILRSRMRAGEALTQAIDRYGPPGALVQASATGYYGDRGQDILTETASPGRGFRADVCQVWEASTANITTRRCILRTGLVLDTREGAFPPLMRFAQLSGRQLGDGRQWIPWIHRRDVGRAIRFLLEEPTLSGSFNVCAPESATNRDFLRAVRRILRRPPVLPAPAWALRALLGEMSSVVLDSQRVAPQRLTEANFPFDFPQLDQALRHLLHGDKGGERHA